MAIAIITRVNELTQILAILVALVHVAVIFWPRKPINEPTDENGMPIVWHNQDDTRRDIACVWNEPSGGKKPLTASTAKVNAVPSFSNSVQPLGQTIPEPKRSAA